MLPAKLRPACTIKPGSELEIFHEADGNFEIREVRPSTIMDYDGDSPPLHPH